MYMSLSDLRAKFINDQPFAIQFVSDALDVGIAADKVDILDNAGGKVDEVKLYGNNDLLHTYVEAVTKMTEQDDAQGKSRLYAYLHSPWDGNPEDGTPGEPEFTIDTNTRVITVPADFAKNGVGVVGDHLAEILFFRMPRFYDVVDLYKSTTIKIYWYNNGNKASTQYYGTTPAVIYAEDEDLVLGWAVSELATVTAGTIEFFVEFEHVREDGLVDFRLETQPAKLTVKPTLTLDKDAVELEQYNDIVYSRAIYSPIINSLTASPARITENLPEGNVDFDPETNNIVLKIDAVSPDGGTLLYHWNWNSIMVDQPNGNLINDETLPNVISYELAEPKAIVFSDPAYGTEVPGTPDTYNAVAAEELEGEGVSPVANGWFIKDGDNYVAATDTAVVEGTTYYVKVPGTPASVNPDADTTYRTLTTNVPGIYQVYIGNQNANGGIRYVYSYITIIEDAHDIVINNALLPGLAYLDNDNSAMTVSVDDANGTVTYKWWHVNPVTGEETLVEGANEATYDPSNGNVITTASPADSANLRGYYYAEAINTKNNTVKHAYSNKVWIELQPVKIEKDALHLVHDGTEFTLTVDNIPYPEATYQMYATVDAQVAKNGSYTTQTMPVADASRVFTGNTATFSIGGLTSLVEGMEYDINVYVVPVSQYGTTYQRYVETTNAQGIRVPDYTRCELKELFR